MDKFRQKVLDALKKEMKGVKVEISLGVPPNPEMGDYAFPCFVLSKEFKKSPNQIAEELAKKIKLNKHLKKIEVQGPYLNFFVNKEELAKEVLPAIEKEKGNYGKSRSRKQKQVMVEFCSPNTNKPLHLGHLRNIFLGESVSRLLESANNKVIRANFFNDRGVHICKSMYAYQKWGKGREPNKKPDHFVGDWYVLFAKKSGESEKYEKEAKDLLKKWEEGDTETIELWKKMNKWAFDGFRETYNALGIKYDKEYFESDIWMYGRNIVVEGLKKGILKKNDEGAVYAQLEEHGLPNKILLRSDGTTIYMTTDLYLAKLKFEDYPNLSKSVYVVASEQDLHFKQLFKIAELMKYQFAKKLFHLSYGMVNLPEGRMKSREGNVVDADDLVEEMAKLAKKEIEQRHKDIGKDELKKRAEQIGLGALKFYMLKIDHTRDMTYNPEESIAFEGETGPYVQYAHARCCSMLKKSPLKEIRTVDFGLLKHPKETAIISLLGSFPDVVRDSADHQKPSAVARYLLDLAKSFSEFYENCPVIQEDKNLLKARLLVVDCVRQVIKNGLELLGIESPEVM
ncbi:arginine--tRNA ligase [Candidatus Woesearchaeota archaeon]|nr:arginine--tRNA ligase [Candidatus Woesearchaeota archaeon]